MTSRVDADADRRGALGVTGCLALAALLAVLVAVGAVGSVLLWQHRRRDPDRCPPPVVARAEVEVDLGGWGEPDRCVYRIDGRDGEVQESILAE